MVSRSHHPLRASTLHLVVQRDIPILTYFLIPLLTYFLGPVPRAREATGDIICLARG